MLIVAIDREGQERPLTPRGNTRIEPGDLLTVYSAFGAAPELTDVFGHYEDQTEQRIGKRQRSVHETRIVPGDRMVSTLTLGIVLTLLAWLGLQAAVLHGKYVTEQIAAGEYNKGPLKDEEDE